MNYPRSGKVPRKNYSLRDALHAARLGFVCICLPGAVTGCAIIGGPAVRVDTTIFELLQRLRGPEADRLMVTITELGDTFVVTCVTLVLMAWLATRQASRAAVYLGAAVGGASVLNTAVKLVAQRARPVADLYTGWSAYSFPSGHATVNAVLYGFLGFLLARHLRPAGRFALGLVLLALVGAIIVSRLYLGAHWFSDVAGSLFVAIPWTMLLASRYASGYQPELDVRTLLLVACGALALTGGVHIWQRHGMDMQRYGASLHSAERLSLP